MARIIGEFESRMDTKQKANSWHHEQNIHTQQAFNRYVKSLTNVTEDTDNPFCNSINDLLTLDNPNIASQAVIYTVG